MSFQKFIFAFSILLCQAILFGCSKVYEEVIPYRTYVALLNQNGAENPTSTVLENTLGITINWVRIAEGKYVGTLNREINTEKTSFLFSTPTTHTGIRGEIRNATEVYLEAQNGINAFTDNLVNLSIELKEYK